MAQAPKAPEPTNTITFYGSENVTYKGRMDDIPDKRFTKVALDGTDSVYYIYEAVNQCGHATPKVLHIMEKTEQEQLNVMPPRSCKGFSKKGILLFETFNYGGNSQNFLDSGRIDDTFPTGHGHGVSSVRVFDGTWELLKKNGEKISIAGQTKFWPDFRGDIKESNDQLYEIRRVK